MPETTPLDVETAEAMGGVAASAPPPGGGAAVSVPSRAVVPPGFDPSLPWRRAGSVALWPEPFGALVYHFGNRRLAFLKSPTLVAVVEALAEQPSAAAALVARGVPEARRPAYVQALADLAGAQMI